MAPGGAPRGFIPTHQEGSEAHYASAAIYQQPQRSQGPSVNFPSAAGSAPAQRASRPIHTPYPSAMPSLNPESEAAGPGLGFQPGMAPSQMQQPQSLYAEGTREPDVARILQPITPAQNPSVYGPPGSRQMPPLRNPLPPPPRDLYELSPYKSLINDLTQTTALLTASYSSQPAAPAAPRRSKTGLFGGKKSGGLFRSLSSARREPNSPTSGQPDVRFVPVFVPSANVASSSTVPAPNNIGQSNPGAFTAGAGPSQSIPPIRFSQAENNPFSGFINHSPHRITYNGVLYPTATHLFEAMKFPHRRDMAEQIRLARNVGDVYPLSASFEQEAGIRPDWSNAFGSIMEDVLHMKFKQHAELRDALLSTGLAPIIYEDPNDTFWGEGPTGQFGATPGRNELGKCLVRVLALLGNYYHAFCCEIIPLTFCPILSFQASHRTINSTVGSARLLFLRTLKAQDLNLWKLQIGYQVWQDTSVYRRHVGGHGRIELQVVRISSDFISSGI
ncbi:hypothetical protein C8J56DRAFT_1028678 [Mycena floridula]|nr:hypothetical protein C8J56DRAFT_1028678 [Mycena floridula]